MLSWVQSVIRHEQLFQFHYINSFDASSCSLVSIAKWLLEGALDCRVKRYVCLYMSFLCICAAVWSLFVHRADSKIVLSDKALYAPMSSPIVPITTQTSCVSNRSVALTVIT